MLLQGFMIYCILLKICPFNQNKRIGKIVQIFQELGKKAISPYELYDLMNDIEVNWQKINRLLSCEKRRNRILYIRKRYFKCDPMYF